MSCKKIERLIYLYGELTHRERNAVNDHIEKCMSCKELLESVQRQQVNVREAGSVRIKSHDSIGLTNRIMHAIEVQSNPKRVTWIDGIYYFFESYFVRYATGAISLSLILFFVYEQQRVSLTGNRMATAINQPAPVLNTSLLMEDFRKKEKEKSGGEKIKLTSLYSCLKHNNCTKRELYFLKINKFYATN